MIARELKKACQVHHRVVVAIAARVRREMVVPLCRRYQLRFNVHPLAALDREHDGCYAFVTDRGEVIRDADQARRLGFRLGRVFVELARSTTEPGAFGGDAPIGNFVRPYMPRRATRGT